MNQYCEIWEERGNGHHTPFSAAAYATRLQTPRIA